LEEHIRAIGRAVLAIVALLLAGTAAAQDRDQQWNPCGLYDEHGKVRAGASQDLVIGACTAIIQSAQESTKGLSAAFANRGNAYRDKREYERAIQDFDQAIKLDPNNAVAFDNRGIAYGHKREYDRAIQDFDKAIRLDPTTPPPSTTAAMPTTASASTTAPSRTTIRRSGSTRISPSPS
jgi:tetratricopeptide (TPR) repeat protein